MDRLLTEEDVSLLFVNCPSPRAGATSALLTSFPFVPAAGLEAELLSPDISVDRGLAEETMRGGTCCMANEGLEEDAVMLLEGAGWDGETSSCRATSPSSWKVNLMGFDFFARFLATCMRGRMLSRGETGNAWECVEGSGVLLPEVAV